MNPFAASAARRRSSGMTVSAVMGVRLGGRRDLPRTGSRVRQSGTRSSSGARRAAMGIGLTEDQRDLASALADWAAATGTTAITKESETLGPKAFDPVWSGLCDL